MVMSCKAPSRWRLETRANGNHRAEATKLFVHRRARRCGLARALMAEVERTARLLGRTLLVMDTRKGGEAERSARR
jgi:acetyltransferase